jgi:beta-phosphoglucomutase
LQKYQGFIFDLDGVIVDSTAVHTAVWVQYLKRFGIDSTGILQRMHGRRNDEIVRDLFGDDLSEKEIHAHGAAKEALYRQVMLPQLERYLVPGIRDFLERHADVPMAVASNAEPANVEGVLETAGLRRFFRVVVDGHQVERPKPWPDVYWKAASLLGADPSHCLVFEDSEAGVRAARGAGARVVGVATTCSDLAGVDLLIRDFRDPELEEWLAAEYLPS